MSDILGNYTPPQFPFPGSQIDFSQVIAQMAQSNLLLAKIQQALLGIAGLVNPASYTVATLPTTASAGAYAWASNGRKPGEGAGLGTGVPIFWNPATTQWFSFLSGAVVTS